VAVQSNCFRLNSAKSTRTKYAKLCFRICQTAQKYANFYFHAKNTWKLGSTFFHIFAKFTAQLTIHINTSRLALIESFPGKESDSKMLQSIYFAMMLQNVYFAY